MNEHVQQYKYIYYDYRNVHALSNVIVDARYKQETILKCFEIVPMDEEHILECVRCITNNAQLSYDEYVDLDSTMKNIIKGKYDKIILEEITIDYTFDDSRNQILWIELQEKIKIMIFIFLTLKLV